MTEKFSFGTLANVVLGELRNTKWNGLWASVQ